METMGDFLTWLREFGERRTLRSHEWMVARLRRRLAVRQTTIVGCGLVTLRLLHRVECLGDYGQDGRSALFLCRPESADDRITLSTAAATSVEPHRRPCHDPLHIPCDRFRTDPCRGRHTGPDPGSGPGA